MSHHVACALPDGRHAIADYRQPITRIIRRVNARTAARLDGDPDDYRTIAAWLEEHPGHACTWEQVRAGTCTHPEPGKPATP
jgi:hypothetical protein